MFALTCLRARPEVSPLVVLRVGDLGVFGGGLSGFAEEGEDDLDLFWGEEFAGAGVLRFICFILTVLSSLSGLPVAWRAARRGLLEWISWAKRLLAVSLLLSGK